MRKQRIVITPELIEQVREAAGGKTFKEKWNKFWWVSESKLYVILRDNKIDYKKLTPQGNSWSTIYRNKKKLPKGDGMHFSFDDFKDSSGFLKIV